MRFGKILELNVALNLPSSSSEIKNRIKSRIQALVSISNPFLVGSWLGALADSFGERIFDFYRAITIAIDEAFIDTTTTNIDRWGSQYNLSRNGASFATGLVHFQANLLSDPITIGTLFADSDGNLFEAIERKAKTFDFLMPSSLTRTGTTATAVFASKHYLNTGDNAVISNASDALYNGTHEVVVVDDNTFTYDIDSGAAASATGAAFTRSGGEVRVRAVEAGVAGNIKAFTPLTLQTPITGVDDDCAVNEEDFVGGADRESDEAFRERIIDLIRNPISHFNAADIRRIAKSVSTITRVFINEATPAEGQVTVYVMSDNEFDPIPNAAKINQVKNAILTIKPANTSIADVIVAAPTKITQNFVFSSLTPNTPTMRASITESLKQFFAESTEVGVDIQEDAYRSAIFATVDVNTGQKLTSFALSSPSTNISVAAGNIVVLGTVTFP